MSKTLIPAAAGTLLLIPALDHNGLFTTTAHPVIGWHLADEDGNHANPIFPCFTPGDVNRASGIEHGEMGVITLPALKLTFTDRQEWEAYAERVCQHDRDEAEDRPTQGEPADLRQERAEDRDEPESPDDDTREYGKTADPERSRRTAAEIAEDEQYLKDVEATGVTIRAANSRFKRFGSRAAVLADLRGESQAEPEEPAANPYADDEDLLG